MIIKNGFHLKKKFRLINKYSLKYNVDERIFGWENQRIGKKIA